MTKRTEYEFKLPQRTWDKMMGWQRPKAKRDSSRLIVLNKETGDVVHDIFPNISKHVGPDLWVNECSLLKCRVKILRSGGRHTWAVFSNKCSPSMWSIYVDGEEPNFRDGELFQLPDGKTASVLGTNGYRADVVVDGEPDFAAYGTVPLFSNIVRPQDEADPSAYSPVYATTPGSRTLATAGIHFTADILKDFNLHRLRLPVVYNSVSLIKEERIEDHEIPTEEYEVKEVPNGPVTAVGTTVVRALESAMRDSVWEGRTNLFIRPPFAFKAVKSLVTNFHVPGDSLYLMCAALAGKEKLEHAYAEAVKEDYDFGFFGDSMLIL